MSLDRITITGADNTTSLSSMMQASLVYPFTEWGILVSAAKNGVARFPSHEWIEELQWWIRKVPEINLSLHICGQWVRDLLVGQISLPLWMLKGFNRIQLNFNPENMIFSPTGMGNALITLREKKRQFIFQIHNGKSNELMESFWGNNDSISAVPLFDASGGRGVCPELWPAPVYMNDDETHCYHGYAGGLSPDNLAEQLPKIAAAAGSTRFWIDMETGVRDQDDPTKFSHKRAIHAISIAHNFISEK